MVKPTREVSTEENLETRNALKQTTEQRYSNISAKACKKIQHQMNTENLWEEERKSVQAWELQDTYREMWNSLTKKLPNTRTLEQHFHMLKLVTVNNFPYYW